MTTIEYLDAIRAKLGISTDYGIAKALGVSKQAAGRWSKGLGGFDEDTCLKVADILGIHPGVVMLDMYRVRAQSDASRRVWSEIATGFPMLLLHAKSGMRFALTR